ncbi:MAG: hypothetical protein EA422_09040 [Gemmatimonadales bacterium]|nr:MAG: hypothetical protein EA422_09040 [Gemmatimonadales bacterium]
MRVGVVTFFILYLLSVVWPGGLLFAGAEPFILGLPFSFFWPAFLVVLGFGALVILYWVEEGEEGVADGPGAEPTRHGDSGAGGEGRLSGGDLR